MNFVADECIDAAIVAGLRSDGHSVWYVAEEAAGIVDDEVLAKAADLDALLVTDDKDFGELVFRQRRVSAGVLLLRLAGVDGATRIRLVLGAVSRHGADMLGAFSVLTPQALRIRLANGPG